MMPICDQTTIAVTIRSMGTASTRRPSEPVLASPMPTCGEQHREQPERDVGDDTGERETGHGEERPAANTSGRGRRPADAVALSPTTTEAATYRAPIWAWLSCSARCSGRTPSSTPSASTANRIATDATQNVACSQNGPVRPRTRVGLRARRPAVRRGTVSSKQGPGRRGRGRRSRRRRRAPGRSVRRRSRRRRCGSCTDTPPPGHRSSVSKVTPIQIPPDPTPISVAGDEVEAQRVAQQKSRASRGPAVASDYDQQGPGAVQAEHPIREREAGDHSGGKGSHQQADDRGAGAGSIGDRWRHGHYDAVPRRRRARPAPSSNG